MKNKKLIIIIISIIFICIIVFLIGQFLYSRSLVELFNKPEVKEEVEENIKKEEPEKQKQKDYSGFYYGCTNSVEYGGEVCIELVLNKNHTAFISDSVLSVGYVGTYIDKENEIIIDTLYNISSENPGINNKSFLLKIDNEVFKYNDSDKNLTVDLTKVKEENLSLYNQMKITEE